MNMLLNKIYVYIFIEIVVLVIEPVNIYHLLRPPFVRKIEILRTVFFIPKSLPLFN